MTTSERWLIYTFALILGIGIGFVLVGIGWSL